MCPTGSALRPRDPSRAPSEFKTAFDILDADRDGKISLDDLSKFYAGLYGGGAVGGGEALAAGDHDVIGTMISVADCNRDGYVEYDEFARVLGYGKRKSNGDGVMEDAFKVMDKDGDGRLSVNDLRSYMSWAGFVASDDEIKAMIKFGGGDDNEGVSFDGLLKILAIDDRRGSSTWSGL